MPYLPTDIVTSVNIVFNQTGCCCHLYKGSVMRRFEVFFVLLKSVQEIVDWVVKLDDYFLLYSCDIDCYTILAWRLQMPTIRAVLGDC